MSCAGWAPQAEWGPRIHKALLGRDSRKAFTTWGIGTVMGITYGEVIERRQLTQLRGECIPPLPGRGTIEAKTKDQQEFVRWKKGGKGVPGREEQQLAILGKLKIALCDWSFGLEVKELRRDRQ